MSATLSTFMFTTMSATLSTFMTSTPITTSNITSMSIINRQSLIGKVYSRYLHSPGSHQSTRFLESVSDSVTHVGSIASHDANDIKDHIKITNHPKNVTF